MKSLKDKVKDLVDVIGVCGGLISDGDIADGLVKIVHEYYGRETFSLFMRLKQLDDERAETERKRLYSALDITGGMFAVTARDLLELKTAHKARNLSKEIFCGDNLAFVIPYCMEYHPDGVPDGGSAMATWWYEKVVDIIRRHKEKYLPGGSSHEWAVNFGWYDYILLLIEKNNL